jgi:hypothetical protein
LGTEKTLPHITLIKIDPLVDQYEVRPGKNKRDFLDQTRDSHGYVCQPMSTIGFHGWEFILPCDVKFIWDGIADEDGSHVKILEGEFINGCKLVDTGTANGTLTFNIGYLIKTDPDHNILMSGAPNTFIDGVTPMDAILQTDWYHWNVSQFCWKINKANEVITIPKGTPFLFIRNYPKDLLETTEFIIKDGTAEEFQDLDKYNTLRDSYRQDPSMAWKWHQLYKRGLDGDKNSHLDKPYKPKPSAPIDLRGTSRSAEIVEKPDKPPRIFKSKKVVVCPFTGARLEVE